MRRLAVSLIVLAGLAGCAQAPVRPALEHVRQSVDEPFVLNGRMAIRHARESSSVGLHWEHGQARDEMTLLAPLGQTVARISRSPDGAELRTGNKRYQAADLESLMEKVLGWHLPLAELHAWVRGQPYPGTPAEVERNPQGQIVMLRQDGWEIAYGKFHGEAADSPPGRLSMTFEDMKLQLVVDEWLEGAP